MTGDIPPAMDRGDVQVRTYVQRRLACSVGNSPTGVTIRSPVAWIAGRKETEFLNPIDKVSLSLVRQNLGKRSALGLFAESTVAGNTPLFVDRMLCIRYVVCLLLYYELLSSM